MNIITNFMTNNDCYKAGRTITVKGIMVHSTATPGVMAEAFRSSWNKPGVELGVHAFVDDTGALQCLPWNHRGWHCGSGPKGSGNNTHVAFEICEPAGFRYAGGATMVGYDPAAHQTYFEAVWQNAVDLCAFLCQRFGFDETAIICHSEGHAQGIASNHADVMHWFPKHGQNMDTFRAAVGVALRGGTSGGATSDSLYKVQTGAFEIRANADAMAARLKGMGYDTYIVQVGGLYKVQTGAFEVKANADAMAARLKADGFDTYIVGGNGSAVSAPPTITVGSKVRVASGARTYTGQTLKSFVFQTTYDVIEVKGDRVVIGLGKAVTAAMRMSDLSLA
jgi:N-acetylmuramoyl-L-alanine amidase